MTESILEREPKLAEAVRWLVAAYQPERIYLFGSVARGDLGLDSDYDLLVIVPDDAPPERRDGGLAYRALWGVGTGVDAVVCTSGWFHARAHLKASLPVRSCVKGGCCIAPDPIRLAEAKDGGHEYHGRCPRVDCSTEGMADLFNGLRRPLIPETARIPFLPLVKRTLDACRNI